MCETERVLETLVGIEVVKRVILGRGPSGKDLLGYFPSLVVGVSDSYSQSILVLKTGSKREVRNVGSENRGWFDEFKVCSQRDAYGITVNS